MMISERLFRTKFKPKLII